MLRGRHLIWGIVFFVCIGSTPLCPASSQPLEQAREVFLNELRLKENDAQRKRHLIYTALRGGGLAVLLSWMYAMENPNAAAWTIALPVAGAAGASALSQYFLRVENDWLGFQNQMRHPLDLKNLFRFKRMSAEDYQAALIAADDSEQKYLLEQKGKVHSSFFSISLKEFSYGAVYILFVSLLEQVGRWSGEMAYPEFPRGVDGVFELPEASYQYLQSLSEGPAGYLLLVPLAYSVFAFLSDGAANYVNVHARNTLKNFFKKNPKAQMWIEEGININKLIISLGMTTLALMAKQGSEVANEVLVKFAIPSAALFLGLMSYELAKKVKAKDKLKGLARNCQHFVGQLMKPSNPNY